MPPCSSSLAVPSKHSSRRSRCLPASSCPSAPPARPSPLCSLTSPPLDTHPILLPPAQLPQRRPSEVSAKRLAKRHKSVNRIYGGHLSHAVVRERIVRAFLIEEQKIVKKVRGHEGGLAGCRALGVFLP